MKTILSLLVLFFTGLASAQILTIPDANFRNKLLAANTSNNIAKNSGGASIKVDADGDTYIEQNEVDLVYELDVSGANISSLNGIQYFNNLEVLNCSNNYIGTLDLTSLSALETVYCGSNSLTTLNITGLGNLRGLYCSDNGLSAINFTGVTDLRWLECNNNQFASLNVTTLADLRELKCNSNLLTALNITGLQALRLVLCSDNQLTSLALSGLDHLEELDCSQNQITTLDFTGLEYLISVNCAINQLTQLDFSDNPAFTELDCNQNNITYINLKNGAIQVYDATTAPNNWSGNPGLAFICIDEGEEAVVTNILAANGLSVNFNTYCSFTPGGDYNTIAGTMLFDSNGDGCDASDTPQKFIKIGINDGLSDGAAFTDENGVYAFYTGAGTFTMTPEFENQGFFFITPSSDEITFPLVDNSIMTDNFCIAANGTHPDVEAVIEPIMAAVPGELASYKLVYKNKGNETVSGTVSFSCDESLIDYLEVDPLPSMIVPGTYYWDFTGLDPFENREISIKLNINSPSDTPPVNVGDELVFITDATISGGDDIPADNNFTFRQKVVGASDPNSITCIEGDTEAPSEIGEYLHYAVNFRNNGAATATNVVIRHDIDPAQFDVNSLQVLNSSHAMRAKVTGNKVEFIMQNANLNALDHGNILFKLKSKASLSAGSTVATRAKIFFDYKNPVETNNATTTFEILSRGDFETDASVKVYPNPAKDRVTISADSNVMSVELYDIQGRLLEAVIVNDVSTSIDLSGRAKGLYFIKVTTAKGALVSKVVKE